MANYGALIIGVGANTAQLTRDIAVASARAGQAAAQNVGNALNRIPGASQAGSRIGSALGSSISGALRGSARLIGRGLDAAWSGIKAAGRAASNVVAVGMGAVAGLGAKAISSGVAYNTLMQKSNAAFKTILGSAPKANALMAQLMDFASKSPFPRQAFIEAAQQMTAFGIESKKVVPYLSAVQDAVAAAGGGAQELSEVSFVMSQISAAGKITGQDLIQFGQRGINAAELIGSQMGKTAAQIKKDISDGALDADKALDMLTKGMSKRFGGAAANVKKTWVGAKDSIAGAMRDVGSAIVEPFISKQGGGLAVTWARDFAGLLKGLIPAAEKFGAAFGKKLADIGKKVEPLVKNLGKIKLPDLSKIAPALAPLIAALGAQGLGQIAGMLGPFGRLVPTLNPVVAALAALVAVSPQLRAALKSMLDSFKPLLPVIVTIGGQLAGIFTRAVKDLAPLVAALGMVIGEALTAGLKAIAPLIPIIANAFVKLLPLVAGVAIQFGQALTKALTALAPILAEVAKILTGALITAFETLAPVVPILIDALARVGRAVAPLMPILAELAGIIAVTIAQAVRSAAPFLTVIAVAIAALAKVIRPVLAVIVKLAKGVGSLAKNRAVVGVLLGIVAAFKAFKAVQAATSAISKFAGPGGALDGIRLRGMYAMDAVKKLGTGMKNAAVQVGSMTKALALSTIAWIKNTAAVVAQKVAQIATTVATKALRLAQLALNAVMAMNPFVLIIAGAAALAAGLVLLWTKCAWFRDGVTAAFNFVKKAVTTAFNAVLGVFRAVFNWVKSNWPLLISIIGGPIGIVVALVVRNFNAIKNAISTAINAVLKVVRAIWAAIRGAFSTALGAIRSVVSSAMGAVRSAISAAMNAVKKVFSTAWSVVRNTVSTAVGAIKRVIGTVKGAVTTAFSGIKEAFARPFRLARDAVKGVVDRIKAIVSSVIGGVKKAVSAALSGISETFARPFRLARDAVQTIIDKIKAIVAGVINGVKGAIDKVMGPLNKLKSMVSGLFGSAKFKDVVGAANKVSKKGRSLPAPPGPYGDVPTLARGGTISPANGGVLTLMAEAGKPERVTPLGRDGMSAFEKAMLNRPTGNTINVFPRANQSETQIVAVLDRKFNWANEAGALR